MPTKAQRLAELDVIQQMETYAAEQRAAEEAARQATMAEIEANRAALARGEPLPPIHTLDGYFQGQRAEEQQAQAVAEAARIAALTPLDRWFSIQSPAKKQFIANFERVNGVGSYPYDLEVPHAT